MHARPAALLVKTTAKFSSSVRIYKDGFEANGKSIMSVMQLAAETGSQVEVIVDGDDAQDALAAISELFANNFYED